jgi:hypothetical protein
VAFLENTNFSTCEKDKKNLALFFQVEKILDVILSSPGTRIGQASECFVYWKDDRRNDTWGLNFTSPIDAKQFRECCDFSKSSARYLYKVRVF